MTSPWNNGQLFSSSSIEWETPDKVFDLVDERFGFDLDASASTGNTKCNLFFSKEDDALAQDWTAPVSWSANSESDLDERVDEWEDLVRTVWMNPPWGRQIGQWVKKAYAESRKGLTVVCLLPACTDTLWWHGVITEHATQIHYIRGRLRFIRSDGHTGPATKGCALVVFAPWFDGPPHHLTWDVPK